MSKKAKPESAEIKAGSRVTTKAFKSALVRLYPILDRKSAMPMLHRVLVRSERERVVLVATDLNVSLTIDLTGDSWVSEEGALTVEGKRLLDVAKVLPGHTATISKVSGELAVVASDRVTAKLISDTGRDFPKVPAFDDLQWSTLNAGVLSDMIDETLFSVCHDPTRFYLNGALMECERDVLRLVTTDGHRLTRSQRTIPPVALRTGAHGLIIPEKALQAIRRLLVGGDARVAIGNGGIIFVQQGDWTLSARAIDAQFPPYAQVIPTEMKISAVVDRKKFVEACKRMRVLTSDERGVKIRLERGELTLTSDDPGAGSLSEAIDSDYDQEHECYTWGMNVTYAMETAERIDGDRLVLGMSGELDPIMMRSIDDATTRSLDNAELVGIVMPMGI